MIVFIPCAGLGTRLRPLTDHCPKALVEYQGKPLLAHLLDRLQAVGCRRFVLNLHHFPDMLRRFAQTYAGENDIEIGFSDESDVLLDTGGALAHALPLFTGESEVLVHNVDVFDNLVPADLYGPFVRRQADALLSVRKRDSGRYLYADADGRLAAWKNLKSGEIKGRVIEPQWKSFAFSGIHLLKTSLIADWADLYGRNNPFSVIDAYLASSSSGKIYLEEHKGGYWKDMGKMADFNDRLPEEGRA